MTIRHQDSPGSGLPTTVAAATGVPWHTMAAADTLRALEVDAASGLSEAEVSQRALLYGPNELTEASHRPWWRAILRQFQDLMIVVLLIAAAVSAAVTQTWETPVAIAVVVVLNASIGFVQESRAEASLESLRKLTMATATVLRGGRTGRVPTDALVPGDLVTLEAGDVVPADGRLLSAASLEVQESTLTGESLPVAKNAHAEVAVDAPLADRSTVVFLGTAVTRGRGELVVTSTGMATESGRIAELLSAVTVQPTPLQRQISGLGRTLALIAGVVVAVVLVLGLVRGEDFGELFVTAVSLAVATIPEGLPAVVAFTLALGAGRLARRGAILKRLASVETLGSTTQICTDKTGTLTVNQMTVREVRLGGDTFAVSGEGYDTAGEIRAGDGAGQADLTSLDQALTAMSLCNDAVVNLHSDAESGAGVGDPTELALVVLAEKGGIDVAALRRNHPRVHEIPFDSSNKYMATFHPWPDHGESRVRCFVKGAPDVLIERADRHLFGDEIVNLDDGSRARHADAIAEMAHDGMRVLAVAFADIAPTDFDTSQDLPDLPDTIALLALVGIVDPPRPEAREAIAQCRTAGIRVRMLTGDHPLTAQAIATEIGLPGRTMTGSDLDKIPDDIDLSELLDEVGVVARVTPSHKLRIVQALQNRGDVVAMTGDGVNDAPALRRADIGIAMGVTGTEVTKDAATAVLTDDNFATIVAAVREGRGIYDNIVKFTRFQVSTALAFVITFLFASLIGLAGGAPFTAVQILFVNLVMDGPPAVSLGVDPPGADVMTRRPRPRAEPILTWPRLRRILFASLVMSGGTLAVLAWAPGPAPSNGSATTAGTMAFATFVFFQIFNLRNVRHDTRSTFTRDTLRNRAAIIATAAVIGLLALVVQADILHGVFATTDLSPAQWLTCVGVGSTILWLGELVKLRLRDAELAGPAVRVRSATV